MPALHIGHGAPPLLDDPVWSAQLRDEGVLIIGSGFLTHGLPFLKEVRIDAATPRESPGHGGNALPDPTTAWSALSS